MFAGLHKGKEALDKAKEDFGREAKLLREVGAEYLVHLPDQYTDMHGGALTESAEIDPEQWQNLISGTNELARYLLEEYGVKLVFHPHADTHVDTQERVERFLSDTDPELVNLCLDTGHISYCDGNNIEIIERFPERITYVHLKQVEPEVRERVRREKLSLAEAVPLGVMCEPPFGEPASRRCWRRWRSWTARSTPSSSRTSTPSSRTSRCRSRPARPATCARAGWARSGAGPTDLFS